MLDDKLLNASQENFIGATLGSFLALEVKFFSNQIGIEQLNKTIKALGELPQLSGSYRPGFESQSHHLGMLLSFIVKFMMYLSCEKNENKQKEAGFGPFKKQSYSILPKVVSKSCKGKQYLYSTLSRRFRIGPNESFSSRKT